MNEQYYVNQNIRFKTAMLRSDSCDYSDTYIGVKGRITVAGTNANNRTNEELTLILHLGYAYQKLTAQ